MSYDTQGLLNADWSTDWFEPVRPLCPKARPELTEEDRCDCGFLGLWLIRRWEHDGKRGIDEKCPNCGDIERFEAHQRVNAFIDSDGVPRQVPYDEYSLATSVRNPGAEVVRFISYDG